MRWLLCLPVCAVADLILGPIMAFIVPLPFMRPEWFPWSMTPDNSIDGDKGHQKRTAGWPPYLRRVWWLLRNRGYGWKLYVIGCKARPYLVRGNPHIKNRTDAVAGWMLLTTGWGGPWYFKFVLPLGFNYCLQWAFGWQLDGPINGRFLFQFSPRTPTRFYPRQEK